MRTPLVCFALLAITVLADGDPPLLITDVTVIDAERVAEHQTVLVQDGRIAYVGRNRSFPALAGSRTLEGHQRFLIPGLIDAHVHFFQSGGLFARPDVFDLRKLKPYEQEVADTKAALGANFRRYLRSGITTVLDIGGPRWNFEVRRAAAADPFAPRVFVAGPLVSTVERPQLDLGDPPIIKAGSADEARALVRAQTDEKPDYIKVWYVAQTPEDVERNFPVVKAAAEEAHRLGFPVAVHATELETSRKAVEAGADLLVHGVMDKPVDDAYLALLKAKGVIYCPTLSVREGYQEISNQRLHFTPAEWVWADPRVLNTLTELPRARELLTPARQKLLDERPELPSNAIALANLKRVWDAGIPVAAGSDAGNPGTPHGPGLYRDFELMVQAGLTPRDVLKSATLGGARVVHRKDLGLIKAGYAADLVLLDADPRASVRNLGQIVAVVARGALRLPAEILPESAADVVWRQALAYNVRDAAVFAALHASDVVVYDGEQVVLRGRGALELQSEARFAAQPLARVRIVDELVEGDTVVQHREESGDGGPQRRTIVTFQVVDGQIARVWNAATGRPAPARAASPGSGGG